MIKVNPTREVSLGHRAFHVAAAASGHIAAFSPQGVGSLLSPGAAEPVRLQLPWRPESVSISANGQRLAVATGAALHVLDGSALRPIKRVEGAFQVAAFGSDDTLWSIVRIGSSAITVEAWDAEATKPMARCDVQDPFGGSAFMFVQHPDEKTVAIWAAAGQDGQMIFRARQIGSELQIDSIVSVKDPTPPSFNASGTQFVVISKASELGHYTFPDGALIAETELPVSDENDSVGDLVSFAGTTHALVSALSGRLYSVCLSRMTVEDELCVIGHEPKLVRELYPRLPNESGFCTDLSFLMQLPSGEFLSLHRDLPSSSNDPWIDRALTWRFPG